MDININYSVEDEEVKGMLRELARKTKATQPAMQDIAVYMKSEVMKNFESQGRPSKWKPLSKRYQEYKDSTAGAGKPVLEFHGKLKQSINERYTNNNAMVRTGVKYGVYHQTGTRKMAARPFMPDEKNKNMPPFHTQGLIRIRQIIERYLMNGVNT